MPKTRNQLKNGLFKTLCIGKKSLLESDRLSPSQKQKIKLLNEKNNTTATLTASPKINNQSKEESKNTIVTPNQIKCML